MGWDVKLMDPDTKEAVEVESHQAGSNIAIGGSQCAEMTVTYNYSPYLFTAMVACGLPADSYPPPGYGRLTWNPLKTWLNGKIASEALAGLKAMAGIASDNPGNNYWEASWGNSGHIIGILITWAEAYPDAVFEVHG